MIVREHSAWSWLMFSFTYMIQVYLSTFIPLQSTSPYIYVQYLYVYLGRDVRVNKEHVQSDARSSLENISFVIRGVSLFVLPAIEGSPFMVRQTLPRITSFLALRLLHPHEKKCKTY